MNKRLNMNKTLVAAAAIAVVSAAPAFAQPSGKLHRAPHAGAASHITHGDRAIYRRALRRAPPRAYAQEPGEGNSADRPVGGYRWPGARYDANGYYIDPNSRGRW